MRTIRRSPLALVGLFVAVAALAGCKCGPKLQSGEPAISVDNAMLDFGNVPVDEPKTLPSCDSCTDGVIVHSVGRAELTLSRLDIQPAGSPFTVDPLEGGVLVLQPGEQRGIPIHFDPPAEQPYTATLTIGSDDPNNGTVTVALSGVGNTHACIATDPSVNFGLVCESTGALQKLTITAGCTADLLINSIGFEADGGSPAFSFVGSTATPVMVPKGQQMFVTIAFQPKPGGAATEATTLDIASSDPANPLVKVPVTANVNFAPIPKISAPPNAAPGETVTVDGSQSTDPDSNFPITCDWTLTSKPFASTADVNPASGTAPCGSDAGACLQSQVSLDVPGPYTVSLTCTDALGCAATAPATANLLAKPTQKLLVEMVWDNPVTDMDLHFLAPGGQLFSATTDCWFGAPNPPFCIQGDPSTYPYYPYDALEGFGPEYIQFPNPCQGTYTVKVVFYKTNGAANPNSNVTVRIFEYGLETAEFTQQLTTAGQVWTPCTVDWPSGNVTAVGTVGSN